MIPDILIITGDRLLILVKLSVFIIDLHHLLGKTVEQIKCIQHYDSISCVSIIFKMYK
jgi:hypothetical protein